MRRRILAGLTALLLFAGPLTLTLTGTWGYALRQLCPQLVPDQVLEDRLSGATWLRQGRFALNGLGGNREQNGVFLGTDGALMLDVQPEDPQISNRNLLGILDFLEDHQRPTYLMLIPTACAIHQSKVPYSEVAPLYDQRQLIDSVYQRASGLVTTIDVYATLFRNQNEYLYYNTEHNLTGLGGYYVYVTAARRLGQSHPRGIEEFSVHHLAEDYYGSLYLRAPYANVTPDRVSAYSFSQFWRTYTMTKWDEEGPRRYYTLYPQERQALEGPMEVLFGGEAPITDIQVKSGDSANNYNQTLLIFGDQSVYSYLPFLLASYERVTVVDTRLATREQLSLLEVSQYSQVLFSYLADQFLNQDQTSLLQALPRLQVED
ncbi:MAG TPA: hypothetical protein H9736_07240 [Candidatus Anaerotruncus excrementipullorum]|uniref:AlgX/AlgJ SGNH hydrolase-like domain-containing protein n=1 Tax=Candidatus Anaerotruncus excrementipullorum TaxID=2838465 RepID=A0A9D2B8F7_9FIRM|nr:hypothetical protein [Candidatus Anaerotruncus excrementipullorum]